MQQRQTRTVNRSTYTFITITIIPIEATWDLGARVLDPRRLSRHPIRCKRWHNPDQVQLIRIRTDAATRQRQDISSSSMLEQQVRVAQDPIKPPWLPFTERNVDPCTFEPSAKEIPQGGLGSSSQSSPSVTARRQLRRRRSRTAAGTDSLAASAVNAQ
jgi:hypothetical protein